MDTIGVILAGSRRPEVSALTASLSGGAGATILAPGMPRTDPRTAALLNAIAGRSVELCDGLRGVQPSVQLVPGLLALAEQRGGDGMSLMTGFLAGYEVAGRLASGFTPRAFAHPNGQLALLACAAAGARFQGFDGPSVSRAMRIATTMLMAPSYLNTVAGATALNLPAGVSATATILAPALADAGYVALDDAIEDALARMVGAGFDPSHLAADLGEDWQIMGNYFRFHACCNPIHAALDCLIDVLDQLRPAPEAIDRIDVATFAFAAVMRDPAPANYFASKYSLPHAAATLIVRGGLGFDELDDSALEDPGIAALRPRVHVTEDAALTALAPALRPARVTLRLKDGREATAARDVSRRDQERPDPEADLRAKFRLLAATVLTDAGVRAVEEAVDRVETWQGVEDLLEPLRRHAIAVS